MFNYEINVPLWSEFEPTLNVRLINA